MELTEKMKELQEGLTAVYNEKVKELLEIKDYLARSIPVALEEVERTLAEEDPLLISQFGPLLREYTEKPGLHQLFTYKVEASSSFNLLRVQTKLPDNYALNPAPRYAGVFKDQAFTYSVNFESISSSRISVNFGEGGSYVELDRNRLLCVGAGPASSCVNVLNLSTFLLSPLPPLHSKSLCWSRKGKYAFIRVWRRRYIRNGTVYLCKNEITIKNLD